MYVNVEDFVKYNRLSTTEKDELPKNEPFLRVVRLLRSETCRGRLHWGKAGWLESGDDRNDRNGTCFDGLSEYGESWCAFTCAAYRYDPGDKFVPAGSVFDPDRNAKFDREKCCGAGGVPAGRARSRLRRAWYRGREPRRGVVLIYQKRESPTTHAYVSILVRHREQTELRGSAATPVSRALLGAARRAAAGE